MRERVWQTTHTAEPVRRLVRPKERTNFNGPTHTTTTCCGLLAAVAGPLKVRLGEIVAALVGLVAALDCAGLGLTWQAAGMQFGLQEWAWGL